MRFTHDAIVACVTRKMSVVSRRRALPHAEKHEPAVPVSTSEWIPSAIIADTSVLSRVYAARTRSYVDPNQEMVGLGVANLAAGFFQGFT